MIQQYVFPEGTIAFDDVKPVKELIAYAFEQFGYEEPLGMDIVTVFQGHHSKTNTGWFTTNTELRCAEEIENPEDLHFAYHWPHVFYFAEGGWGHHMRELGNHPEIPDGVLLHLRVDDADNALIINGQYRFIDIVDALLHAGYIGQDCKSVKVIPVGCAHKAYAIPFTDPILGLRLSDFGNALQQYHTKHIRLDRGESIYHEILQIG